jgi:hypothetical protein
MSEDTKGLSSEKSEETEVTNSPNLQGNLDDIFDDDDDAAFSLDAHDGMLNRADGSSEFENTFDDVSPPASKKIKLISDEPTLAPQPPTREANDLIQDTGHSNSAWQDDDDHFPHRRTIILKM